MSAYVAEVEPHDGLGFGWRIALRKWVGEPGASPTYTERRTWALTRRGAERRAIALVAEAERQEDLAAERAARAFTVRSQRTSAVYPRPPAGAPAPEPPRPSVADELRAKGYRTHRVTPDPLRAACPTCGAVPGLPCRVLSPGLAYVNVSAVHHARTGWRA